MRPAAARLLRILGRAALGLLTLWTTLALAFGPLPAWIGLPAALISAGGSLWILRFAPERRRLLGGLLAGFAVLWTLLPPSNTRAWRPDVATPATAEISEDRVLIRGLRNCRYRSETDYDVRLEERELHLSRLRSVDLFLVTWGSPAIAHTMLSFGFEGEGQVCFSIETRNEAGESYSAMRGFFKNYELIYVVGDERDLVGLRTTHRKGEEVRLYRLQVPVPLIREVFLDYLAELNRLAAQPEWYNVLTNNCTSNIRGHTKPYARSRWDWRLLLNGHLDELVYETGVVDRSLPFEELKRRSLINAKARAAGTGADFSSRIREGLPGKSP